MAPRQLAEATDYLGLLVALRNRADELQISRATIDALSGMPERYCAKIFSLKQVRRVGMISLGPILGALAIKLVIVEDKEALDRIASRLEKRSEYCIRSKRRKAAS